MNTMEWIKSLLAGLVGGADGYVPTFRNGRLVPEAASGGTGNGGMFRVRVATTANGTLATAFDNGSSVDGVTLATGDVILVKNQTSATENGVYEVVASGAPTRVTDFETGDTVHGYVVSVVEGTTNADSVWLCTNNKSADVVGTDNLTFARLGAGGPGLLNVRTSTGAKTAGAVRAVVEVQAAGGGGGGVDSVTGTTNVARASGGGGGGYIKHYISDLSAIATYTITTGSGGSGGAAGANNGTAGGNSVYSDGTTTLTANGGGLGQGSTGATTSGTLAGGAGGSASGGNLMNVAGQNGTDGCRFSVADPGGGTMSQNNCFPNGGNSQLGLGGIAPPTVGLASVAGVAGTGYGGGGSGAVAGNSATDRAGGNGADGIVIVWEYGHETTSFDATISTLTEVAIARDDYIPIGDTSDGGANKKVLVSDTFREFLTAARTYYVRTDGSDSNTGLVDSAGGAFRTIQKAVDVASALDNGGYAITIDVGNGTYTAGVTLKAFVGSGAITITGDTATPANVVINPTSATGILAQYCGQLWYVTGVKITTTTAGHAVICIGNGTVLTLGLVEFGAVPNGYSHMFASNKGQITFNGNYNVSGGTGAGGFHMLMISEGVISPFGRTVTITGTLAIGWWCYCDRASFCEAYSMTFTLSGGATVTGVRYFGGALSCIFVNGGGASYFPGNSAGSVSGGSQYI